MQVILCIGMEKPDVTGLVLTRRRSGATIAMKDSAFVKNSALVKNQCILGNSAAFMKSSALVENSAPLKSIGKKNNSAFKKQKFIHWTSS